MEITGTFKKVQGVLGGRTANHVLGFWLDGNVVQLVEVRRDLEKGEILVEGIAGHEDDRLLEIVERVRHPIFMDLQHIRYPDPKRVGDIVKALLDKLQPETLHTVGCMAGETVRVFQTLCHPNPGSYENALRGLLSQIRINNPLMYPFFFTIRRSEGVTADGEDQLILSTTHYPEVRGFLSLMKELPLRPVALSNSRQALAGVAGLFDGLSSDEAILLTDVGRLRTHYVGTTSTRLILNNMIPIGLARGDSVTYRALPLKMKEVVRMNASVGPLLLPPELTPPSFGPAGSTPQLECTHTAYQVGHYLARAIEWAEKATPPASFRTFVLSGLPSRLAGFRKFLQARTGRHLERPDHLTHSKFTFKREEDERRFADFLVPLGATLRAMGSPATGITAIPYGSPPVDLEDRISLSDLEPGVVYQVDQPFKLV